APCRISVREGQTGCRRLGPCAVPDVAPFGTSRCLGLRVFGPSFPQTFVSLARLIGAPRPPQSFGRESVSAGSTPPTTPAPPIREGATGATATAMLSRELADFLVELSIAMHKHAIY